MAVTDETLLRRAALAAFENAAGLCADAQLLDEHGRYARAVSLCVLGNEEIGKGILYTLAALGTVPGLRDRLPGKPPITRHNSKQVTIEFAQINAWLIDEYYDILRSEAGEYGFPDDLAWFVAFFRKAATSAIEEVDWLEAKDAKKPVGKLSPSAKHQEGIRQLLASTPISKHSSPPRTPDELKWSGLYVGIELGEVWSPSTMRERECRASLSELAANLDIATRVATVLQDDSDWVELRTRLDD